MIRHGRHVPSQCPKQKHFPPVLVAIFNISGGWLPLFRALARNMAPMTNIVCSFPPEILKMATNTGGKCFCFGHWLGTWRRWRIITTAPYAFFNEVVPLCSLYSLVWSHMWKGTKMCFIKNTICHIDKTIGGHI